MQQKAAPLIGDGVSPSHLIDKIAETVIGKSENYTQGVVGRVRCVEETEVRKTFSANFGAQATFVHTYVRVTKSTFRPLKGNLHKTPE